MAGNIRTGLRTRYIPTGEATTDASALGAMIAPRDPQLADVQNIVDTEGSAQRGFRQGLRGTLGMSEAYLANALEAAGRKQAADALYAAAQDQLQQGAMVAPRVTDYRDVGNVSDAWDYAAGMAGQGVASTLPAALATGLAKRPIAQYLAGAGAMLPQQAGENVLRLRDDPVAMQNMTAAERFGLSTLTGGAQAVAEEAVPFLVSKRLGLRTTPAARNMARDVLGGAGVEGLTEGVQERMGQTAHSYANPNRDTSGDAPDIVNAVLGGAAGGGAMVAPGAMIAHGLDVGKAGADKGYAIGKKAAELGAQGLEVAKDKAVDLGDAAAEKAEPVMAAIRGQAGKAMDQAKVQWLAGKDSLPDDIASDPEAVMKHLAEQDSQRKSVVADYLNGVANDESAHPERRAQAADMLGKLDDPETFRMAANVVVGMEKVKGHAQRVNELLADAADFGKGFLGKKKQNAQAADDLSKLLPADRLITQHLLDGLEPEAVEAGADKLVPIFRGMFNGKLPPQLQHRALRDFIGIYGDSAPEIASKIAVNIQRDDEGRGMDPDATRKAFQELMATDESRMDTRHEAVRSALTNEVKDRIQQELGRQANDSDVRTITDLMSKLVDGSLSEKSAPAVESELKSMLGDRYKHTLNVFRAIHESEAWEESPLFNDSNEYEDQMESKSFGTMLEGVNRRWSLANKTDESGIAPMFDSREEAQKRWDENIAPKYPGYEGRVVTGDQYAAINGTDPLALAAQYDDKFKTVPSDYKAKAQHLKDAMALLRTKHVVQMDMVSNDDTDVLSDKELRQVLAKSALPVERTEEGKAPIRNTKPPVSAGYIFVHVGSRVRPIKMSALEYVVRGKQQKEAFGGTGDKHEGSHDTVRAVMTGLARLADSGSLNIEAGVFGYDQRGGRHWIIAPKGERANMKAVEALKVGQTTLGKLMEESKTERKEGSQKERQRSRNMLLTKKIEESDHLKEDIRVAAAEANDAIANGTDEEQQAAIKSLQELKKERGALWDDDITERDVTDKLMESDQRTAAENAEERDNGELNEIEKLNAGRQDDEVKSAAAEIAKRSNIQKTSVGNTSDKLAKQIEAKLAEQSATITSKATGAIDYMNSGEADPEMVARIGAWVDKQYARTNDPDTISLLNDLKKLVGQQAPRKKSNAMSVKIHEDLGKDGFGATHDSPIRHEGKFNWREHIGKGEGNAAFGAGTYLSTASSVHRNYKNQFTAQATNAQATELISELQGVETQLESINDEVNEINPWWGEAKIGAAEEQKLQGLEARRSELIDRKYKLERTIHELNNIKSPTYHVTVNAKQEELLDWDAPLSKQSDIVKAAVSAAVRGGVDSSIKSAMTNVGTNKYGETVKSGILNGEKFSMEIAKQFGGKVKVRARVASMLDEKRFSGEFDSEEAAVDAMAGYIAGKRASNVLSGDIHGSALYSHLIKELGSQAKASDYLQSLGIVGHKYNSEGGRNSKFPNYVIYDDSRIETNYVSFSKQQSGKVATDTEVQEAKDYIHKVLGRKIKAEFVKDLGGISGEWEEGATENIVRVALNAGPGVLSVAHHEAMHEFFDRLTKRGAKDVAQALVNVANSPMVRKRLEVLLRNEPEALKQIRNDQEERLAYMYQFWAAKRLEVGPKATSVFEKIKAFFRKITGMLNESERAENVLRAFHNGDLSKLSGFGKAVQAVANQDNALTKGYKKLAPLAKRAQELVYTSEGVLTSHDNATLDKLAAMFNTGANSTGRGQGYLNAKAQEMNRWLNRFNSAIEGLEREELDAIRDALRTETMPTTAHLRAPAREIRTILDDFYKYATAAGVPLKQLRNYFPQVWDSNEIMARSDEFKELLLKHHSDILEKIADTGNKKRIAVLEKQIKKADPAHAAQMTKQLEEMKANPHTAEDVADTITQRLLAGNGVSALSEDEDRVGYTPLMSAVNSRSLNFIDKEVFADFFEKDTVRIMSNYLSQGVHRAEYARRFGNEGAVIADMLDKAFDEEVAKHRAKGDDPTAAMTKATATIESTKRAVMAMEGTLGHDISPTMRKWSSYMMVYQNLRILPMALFSSLIDPMGLAVRGGTLNDSLEGLRRGVKEIANSIKGEHSTDEMTKLAEAIGTVDNAAFMDALGETYNSIYMTGWAKKLNDKMFQWNGMEAWNRGMRVAATQAAIEFIKRNVENPGPHSQRWLEELGLTKDDVVITNGKLEVLEGPNLNAIQAHRTQAAIQRWVDSAVLRPNAAQRPPWASDPHYALLFHMKQFTYSFQKTILARVTNEWREGNLMPALALAWYVPFMIAADMAKAVLQGMGDEPDYMKGWTVQDYMARGIQRAGLLGVGQFGMDAYNMGAESILGPTAEQAVDALKDPIDKTAIDALPVNPLYKNALK